MASATISAVVFAAAAAATPSASRPPPSAAACAVRIRPDGIGPFRPLQPIDLAVEDVVEHDAAGVERGGGEEQPRERGAVAEPGDGEAGQHVGERGRHVGRAQQLKIGAKHRERQ